MAFKKTAPVWKAGGTEPPESLKERGFEAGYKPPAAFFNWFWSQVSGCLADIYENAANSELSGLPNKEKATGNLLYRGNIGASNIVNANTLTNIGIYKVYIEGAGISGENNYPSPYGVMFVNAAMDGNSYDYVSQIFCSVGNNKLIMRCSSDNGATWTNWVKMAEETALNAHIANKSNPHGVTPAQIGAVATMSHLIAGADLDTVTTSGMYRLYDKHVNAPSGSEYAQMLVVHGGGDTIAQVLFTYNGSRMWVRSGNPSNTGGNGMWREWAQVYSTYNKPSGSDIATGGTEGQLLAVNANGTISPNSRKISSLGTGVTYKLEGTTLTITTIKE